MKYGIINSRTLKTFVVYGPEWNRQADITLIYEQNLISADTALTYQDAFGIPSLAEALFGYSVAEFATVVAA